MNEQVIFPEVEIWDALEKRVLASGTYAIFPKAKPTSFLLVGRSGEWREAYLVGRYSLRHKEEEVTNG